MLFIVSIFGANHELKKKNILKFRKINNIDGIKNALNNFTADYPV